MEKPYGYDQFEQFIARKNIKRFLKSVDSFHMPGLVGAEDKLFPFLEREETIRPTVAMMCDRWKAGIFSDKSNNPLMGFHSVPGGGKSYLIDEFVRLNFKDGKN
jgi:hypothetical protein